MEGLPVSPFMDREKVTKPSSQCSFIGFVLLPLFEALGEVLTELDELIIEPVREALEYYRSLNEDTKKETDEKEEKESPEDKEEEEEDGGIETEAVEEESDPSSPSNLKKILSKTESFTSLRSRTSSRTSGLLRAASSRETDPEFDGTETEVEVSERTSKFKISTEASRRNSCERKGSIDRRYSVDRTVSPHSLVERLRPHVETEVEASFPAESEQEILNEDIENVDQKIEWQSASIFNKIRYLSGRLSVDFDNKPDSTLVAEKHRKYSTPIIQGVLKRKKENESAENSRNLFSSQKTHISFATSECESIEVGRNGSREPLISKQNDPSLEDKKPVITDTVKDKKCEELKRDDSSNVESSPTHSEKIISSPNSFLRQKKKFSLSLDVLPRRNGKPKKESSQTQRVSSDDLLSRTSRSNSKKLCQNSPKSLKKKHESAKAILLRSFSFRRRSSSKSEDQVPMTAVECTKSDDL
ncbi:hypothetical protein Avbf_13859 [Armadillidium vulgare]|nr:hypothetical protein Avbf_13859 [Armadillidium vulgare]